MICTTEITKKVDKVSSELRDLGEAGEQNASAIVNCHCLHMQNIRNT